MSPHCKETVTRPPERVWIEPTTRCNARCIGCPHHTSAFGEDLSDEVYHKICDGVLQQARETFLLGLGEPFLSPHFDDLLDQCERRDTKIVVISNGTLLRDKQRAERVVRSRMNLYLSIDGAHAEIYEAIRTPLKWSVLIEALECLQQCAREAGNQRRFRLGFNFVTMKRNVDEMPGMVELAAQYDAETVALLPLAGDEFFDAIEHESLRDAPERLIPPLTEALKRAKRLGVTLDVPQSFTNLIVRGVTPDRSFRGRLGRWGRTVRFAAGVGPISVAQRLFWKVRARLGAHPRMNGPACSLPWTGTFFAGDGRVFPCAVRILPVGDLNRQSWDDVWNGTLYRSLRRTIFSWNPTKDCRHCCLTSGIGGGDSQRYDRFFARFEAHALALDDPSVRLEGFHALEHDDAGRAFQSWMPQRGRIVLPMRPGARFLRLRMVPTLDVGLGNNPGVARINDAAPEPFDTTCAEIHFPIDRVRSNTLEVALDMEWETLVEGDPRPLALGLRGIEFLM